MGAAPQPDLAEFEARLLFVDNHLLAINKRSGWPSVPDSSGDLSALELGKQFLKLRFNKPGEVFLGVVQRLDRPVSGVLIFARTSKAAKRLTQALKEHRLLKTYLALGRGSPAQSHGTLEQWLQKDPDKNRVRPVGPGAPGAKLARTRWRASSRGEECGFALWPETGRSHQLRVACASLGSVLLGDLRYGAARALPDQSIALHSFCAELNHPTQLVPLHLEAPLPEAPWWKEWTARLRELKARGPGT